MDPTFNPMAQQARFFWKNFSSSSSISEFAKYSPILKAMVDQELFSWDTPIDDEGNHMLLGMMKRVPLLSQKWIDFFKTNAPHLLFSPNPKGETAISLTLLRSDRKEKECWESIHTILESLPPNFLESPGYTYLLGALLKTPPHVSAGDGGGRNPAYDLKERAISLLFQKGLSPTGEAAQGALLKIHEFKFWQDYLSGGGDPWVPVKQDERFRPLWEWVYLNSKSPLRTNDLRQTLSDWAASFSERTRDRLPGLERIEFVESFLTSAHKSGALYRQKTRIRSQEHKMDWTDDEGVTPWMNLARANPAPLKYFIGLKKNAPRFKAKDAAGNSIWAYFLSSGTANNFLNALGSIPLELNAQKVGVMYQPWSLYTEHSKVPPSVSPQMYWSPSFCSVVLLSNVWKEAMQNPEILWSAPMDRQKEIALRMSRLFQKKATELSFNHSEQTFAAVGELWNRTDWTLFDQKWDPDMATMMLFMTSSWIRGKTSMQNMEGELMKRALRCVDFWVSRGARLDFSLGPEDLSRAPWTTLAVRSFGEEWKNYVIREIEARDLHRSVSDLNLQASLRIRL